MARDYYAILGVNKNATKEEIQRAYKNLAKKYHPDLNKAADATEKFKEINEASSVLTDEKKRAQYDQFGSAGQQGFGAGASGFDFGGFSGFSGGFEDLFENMFSGFGFGRQGPRRGADLEYTIALSLEEAERGFEKIVIIPRSVNCSACNGTGAEKQALQQCSSCQGSGKTVRTQQTPFGVVNATTTCSACAGRGQQPKIRCKKCNGIGRRDEESKIKVSIPAGIEDGMRVRLSGEGEAGEIGATPGDLFILVTVKPHKHFKRVDDDLHTTITLPFVLAVLGGEYEVFTVEHPVIMKIPSGTQSGTVFNLRKEGMPNVHTGKRGDLKVNVTIEVPRNLNKKQKQLLEQFAEQDGKKGLFSKLKKQ